MIAFPLTGEVKSLHLELIDNGPIVVTMRKDLMYHPKPISAQILLLEYRSAYIQSELGPTIGFCTDSR